MEPRPPVTQISPSAPDLANELRIRAIGSQVSFTIIVTPEETQEIADRLQNPFSTAFLAVRDHVLTSSPQVQTMYLNTPLFNQVFDAAVAIARDKTRSALNQETEPTNG